ncbi:putative Histidine kinase [Verrucomicrobia bacterium]|nr:putative Histidine kinase [Verrucomicrobiota bacterium]
MGISLVVIGLALAAILEANQATRQGLRAVRAEQDAREKLWNSYLSQARGARAGPQAGHRFDSLHALTNAASLRPSPELRNEAAACLTLADLRVTKTLSAFSNAPVMADANFERYARAKPRGDLELRRTADDEFLFELPPQGGEVRMIHRFSPNGRFLPVTYADGMTTVWDLSDRRPILRLPAEGSLCCLDFTPDNQRLVAALTNGCVGLYELGTGRQLQSLSSSIPELRLRVSPDGSQIALFSESQHETRILDLPSGRVITSLPHRAGVRGVAWHPNGRTLATACDDFDVYVWRPPERRPVMSFSGHQSSCTDVAFHPGGQLLASSSWDGTTRLWDLASNRQVVSLAETGPKLCFSADGQYLAFLAPDDSLRICDVAARRVCRFLHEPDSAPDENDRPRVANGPSGVSFNADEKLLASGSYDGVRLWDTTTGLELAHLPAARTFSVFFSLDGKQLLACGQDGLVRWSRAGAWTNADLDTAKSETLLEGPCRRACPSFTDEECAVIKGEEVRLLRSGRNLPGPPDMNWIAMSPDSQYVAASTWRPFGVRLWEAQTGRKVFDLPFGPSKTIAFSPDSRWLVTGGEEEYCFWDVHNGQPGRRLPRRDANGLHGPFGFSPDGRLMAIARSRTQIQLLDAVTFAELVRLESPVPQLISWIAFSPSGKQLAVATEAHFIQLWDLGWLRQQLFELGLDWGKQYPSILSEEASFTARAPLVSSGSSLRGPTGLSHLQFVAVSGAGVGLALCLATFVLRRHQRLVLSYQRLDDLAAQRARELEAAQRELLQSEKMKALGTLAAGIAHDFNNLLSIIRMANHLVARAVRPAGVTKENIDAIEQAVAQGQQIVRSMLGYSRQQSDATQAFSVTGLVAETMALVGKQFLSGIVLTLELDPQTPLVTGSKVRLEQILLNLIVNAAEAMNGQGDLRIAAHASASSQGCILSPRGAQNFVEVEVADSGPGIAPEVLPRIFEPFFTTKDVGVSRGTGLGLSTVYGIAQQDGLGLGVETQLQRGTTFRVLVPVAPVAYPAAK